METIEVKKEINKIVEEKFMNKYPKTVIALSILFWGFVGMIVLG